MSACVKCGHDPEVAVLRSWSFHVPRAPESLNAHSVNAGLARFVYAKKRNAWLSDLATMARVERIPEAIVKRRVTLTRVYHGRCRAFDRDNLAGGMKMIVDALVLAGLITDDSPRWAELHFAQRKVSGASSYAGLDVHIEELAA